MKEFLPYIGQSLSETLFSLQYFLPEIFLALVFLIVIIAELFFFKRNSTGVYALTIAGIAISGVLSYLQLNQVQQPVSLFHGMVVLDRLSVVFKLIFAVVSILFLLFIQSNRQLARHKKGVGDLYIVLIGVHLGLHLMAMSANLLMVFIAIEMVSLGSYLMVGYMSGTEAQSEASMKYVLFGSVCSAVMLYGISLMYGYTGTLNIYDPAFVSNLSKIPALGSALAIVMILVGIGFKLSFIPFHFWSPDVYEGAPTPVTAFLSTGPKVAGFALLLHFLASFKAVTNSGSDFMIFNFSAILAGIAILTMVLGNFSAIWQNNIKRLLAYSSIGHTGFLLIPLLSFSTTSYTAIVFYLFIYSIMNMTAFMLVDRIEQQSGAVKISDYKGLGKILKIEAFCFVIVLLSLTGLPPTSGFIAKFLVFSSGLESYTHTGSLLMLLLIITGAITTVISLFYYFKVPLNFYLRDSMHSNVVISKDFQVYLIVFLTIVLIFLGIFPGFATDFLAKIILG